MSVNQNNVDNQEAPASLPQITPKGIGYGHPEYHFVQSVMELQKSNVEISTNISHLVSSVDSMKSKVDDLIKWKTLIIGGAVAIGFILATTFTFFKVFGPINISFEEPPGHTQEKSPK